MAGLDEEQHYERFDMDNDYEAGEFIGGEFFHQGDSESCTLPAPLERLLRC